MRIRLRYYSRIYTRCSIGHNNGKSCSTRVKVKSRILVDYILGNQRLNAVEQERDLGL